MSCQFPVQLRGLNGGKVIIFTAVRIETRAIERALAGENEGRSELYTIGIGARHLPKHLETSDTVALVMAGLAGALDPGLRIGDLVIDDPGTVLQAGISIRRGKIYTAAEIVATAAQKAELFSRSGAAAVDMEGDLVRAFADRLGLPYVAVRAISDMASEALDPAVVGLVDNMGRAKPLAIASVLLRRPGMARYLKELGANANFAVEKLGAAVRTVVDSLREQRQV